MSIADKPAKTAVPAKQGSWLKTVHRQAASLRFVLVQLERTEKTRLN